MSDGGPRALICSLSPDRSHAASGLRPSALRGHGSAPTRAVPSLAGDRGRAHDLLPTLIEGSSPDWLILEPDRSLAERENAISACFRFVDEALAG